MQAAKITVSWTKLTATAVRVLKLPTRPFSMLEALEGMLAELDAQRRHARAAGA